MITKNTDKLLNNNALSILNCAWHGRNRRQPMNWREIMKVCGFSSNNALTCHLKRLKKLGLVDWAEDKTARTLMPRCRFIPADQLGLASVRDGVVQ